MGPKRNQTRRENRARRSRSVLEFFARWLPGPFEDRPAAVVKEQLLSFAGRDLAWRMRAKGLLSQEEEWHLSYLNAIVDSSQPRSRQFVNIYDLVLYGLVGGFERADAGWIFRGQRDAQWDLLPSFYRTRPGLLRPESKALADLLTRELHALEEERAFKAPFGLRSGVLAEWHIERQRILNAFRSHPAFSLLEALSEYQQDAVIQHYHSGTPLLDCSRSLCVAAFFATQWHGRRESRAPTKGAVYVVSPRDLEENLVSGRVAAIEVPAIFERPLRQKAVFILTAWPELLRDGNLFDVWTFFHTEVGLGFECADLGVSRAMLLPDPLGFESGDPRLKH